MRWLIGLGLLGCVLVGGCGDEGDACDVPQQGLVFLLAWEEQDLDLTLLTPTSLPVTHESTQGIGDCEHICGNAKGGGEEAIHCDPAASGNYSVGIVNSFAGSVSYDLEIYVNGSLVDEQPANVGGNETASVPYTHSGG